MSSLLTLAMNNNTLEQHICWGANQQHACSHRLDISHVNFSYGLIHALQDVTFSTTCGHTIAIMGPNGAGKSTLLKTIAGLLTPVSGQILWKGEPLHSLPREIAYLPQRSKIDWNFPITVQGLVEMGRYPALGLWKKFSVHDQLMVQKALATMELADLAQRQIGELSGGQQQRVFLARALAQEAHILLLDEPFTGLDYPASKSLSHLLRSLAREGRLIVTSYHDLKTAADLFDTIILLNRKLYSFGPPQEVLVPSHLDRVYLASINKE